MADHSRNQTNQNMSRGQTGRHSNDPNRAPGADDESIGRGGSGGRSNREPASTADDRGMDEPRRSVEDIDELDDDTALESDIDDVDDER
jgi:hypothetical protein